MAAYQLEAGMAQEIVSRTMQIIDSNVNVMDGRGRIIGSGDPQRLGELHEGALLAIAQGRRVEIDSAVARGLHGVRPGVNLPLRIDGEIVGAVGLSGEPETLRRYGQLVSMTAEMMLEQARLQQLLARDSRLREELVLNLIRAEGGTSSLAEWAQRLGVNLDQPWAVALIEVEGQGPDAGSALHEMQALLAAPGREPLLALVSLHELVWLVPAPEGEARGDALRARMEALLARAAAQGLEVRLALGNGFSGPGGIARSYRTARATLAVGKQRLPAQRGYFYPDLRLPVLLDSLRDGWQAEELAQPLARLWEADSNGLLRRTLRAWFAHDVQPGAAARALFIHRNTLEYRLNRIADVTGLDLTRFDHRLLLYVALQLEAPQPE